MSAILTRLFLVSREGTVILREEGGDELAFPSLAEFKRVTGHDLTGKTYLGYEPTINSFIDAEDPAMGPQHIPFMQYESFIDNIELYRYRLQDPYYGRTNTEQKQLAFDNVLAKLDEEYNTKLVETFEFDGHMYYADFRFIIGMCVALLFGLLPADHVESWKTADKEADGITNIYVDLDKDGVVGLGLALLVAQKSIFSLIDPKKSTLKALFQSDESTYQDLLALLEE